MIGKMNNRIAFICGILLAIGLGGIAMTSCGNGTIADVSIDKVSPELKRAVQKYDRLYSFHEGLARVEKDGKFGYIDKLGKEIIPCKYDDAEDFNDGIAVVKINEKCGCINSKGRIKIPLRYQEIYYYSDGLFPVKVDDKWGYMNQKGEIVVPCEYEWVYDFFEGMAAVESEDDKIGFIDSIGQLVIPCQYDELFDGAGFSEGLCGVRKDDTWGYIDKNGKVEIPFNDELVGAPFEYGLSIVLRWEKEYEIIMGGLRVQKPLTSQMAHMAFINKEGEIVSNWINGSIGPIRDTYYTIRYDGGVEGLYSIHGDVVISPDYNFSLIAHGHSGDGLVFVRRYGEGAGFFNIKKGELAIPCEYEYSGYKFKLCEGLVSMKKHGKAGFINSDNETIIPFIYDYADDFSEGFAVVERYGKYGYVDRYGNDTFGE